MASCGGKNSKQEKTAYEEKEILESNLNLEAHEDKKFIQTADVKFKVKNVFQTTMIIEDVVAKYKGFIAYTNLQNRIQAEESHQISDDSSLKVVSHVMGNHLRIRIPNKNLQKFFRALNQEIAFPNHRIIEAKEVSLDILDKELTQKRLKDFGNRTQNTNLADSLKQVRNKILLENQSRVDENLLAQKSIEEQIKLSTIEMYIYQNPKIAKEVVAIMPQNFPKYEPAFSTQLKNAFSIALNICKYAFLALVIIFPFVLFGFLGYLTHKNKKRWKFN